MPRSTAHAIFCLLVGVTQANAEILVDDFGDSVSIALPFPGANDFVDQTGIGPLSAMRRTSVVDLNVDVEGSVTVDASQLLFRFSGASPDPTSGPILRGAALNLTYDFPVTVDATQGGQLGAVAIDISSLGSSAGVLDEISVFLQDLDQPGFSFGSIVEVVPTSSSPFTVVLPFDTFVVRGGTPLGPFDRVNRLTVGFSSLPGDQFDGAPSFDLRVDAIRFITVPEPPTFVFAVVLQAAFMSARRESHGYFTD